MDSDIMGTVGAYLGFSQAQLMSTVQTKLLRNALDDQTQQAQQLIAAELQGPALNPPNLGQNLDMRF